MSTSEQTQTQVAWDEIAAGYDRTNTPSQMWVANEGLRRAGLSPGMRFLDVAAGSGALSIPAARLGARVLATDLSPAMLELLERRARDEGLSIETRVMDGHALDLDDDSFDLAGSQFGVMLFPDMPKGIAEMARVVRPGGRVVILEITTPQRAPLSWFYGLWFDRAVPALGRVAGDPDAYSYLPSSVKRFPGPRDLAALMAGCGLRDVRWILTAGGIIAIHVGTVPEAGG